MRYSGCLYRYEVMVQDTTNGQNLARLGQLNAKVELAILVRCRKGKCGVKARLR